MFQLKKGQSGSAKEWRLFSAGLHGLVIEHKLDLVIIFLFNDKHCFIKFEFFH